MLLFRGKIFEWGSKRYPWPKLGRPAWSCDIKWKLLKERRSKCTLDEIETWNEYYVMKYGPYRLFSNNCHHYVNRLAFKLSTDCRDAHVRYVKKASSLDNEEIDNEEIDNEEIDNEESDSDESEDDLGESR